MAAGVHQVPRRKLGSQGLEVGEFSKFKVGLWAECGVT